jgi:hypothetical protein
MVVYFVGYFNLNGVFVENNLKKILKYESLVYIFTYHSLINDLNPHRMKQLYAPVFFRNIQKPGLLVFPTLCLVSLKQPD